MHAKIKFAIKFIISLSSITKMILTHFEKCLQSLKILKGEVLGREKKRAVYNYLYSSITENDKTNNNQFLNTN